MNCPNCSAAAKDDEEECPSCGLGFAKWRELQAKKARETAEALGAGAPAAPAFSWDRRTGRMIAAGLVGLWTLGMVAYYRHQAAKLRALGEPTGAYVEMRDPKTGDMRRMPIVLGPGARRRP